MHLLHQGSVVKCFRPQCALEATRVFLTNHDDRNILQYCSSCADMMTRLWDGNWHFGGPNSPPRHILWEEISPDAIAVIEVHSE